MLQHITRNWTTKIGAGVFATVMSALSLGASMPADADPSVKEIKTATPIKHVIIIVGENRSFDHLFATYEPKDRTRRCATSCPRGIINADGAPGPNFAKAHQFKIASAPNGGKFFISADLADKQLYATLPPPDVAGVGPCPPYVGILSIPGGDPGLPPADQFLLGTGGTGLDLHVGSGHADHQRQRSSARAVPDDRADHALRRLHGRHDPSVLPDVPAGGLRHRRGARVARTTRRDVCTISNRRSPPRTAPRPRARRTTPARPWPSSTCRTAMCRCSSSSPTTTR